MRCCRRFLMTTLLHGTGSGSRPSTSSTATCALLTSPSSLAFVSSVVVPSSAVPEKWRWLLLFNPMSGYVEGFRAALFGQPFDWRALAVAAAITLFMLAYAAFEFRRMEKSFADVI